MQKFILLNLKFSEEEIDKLKLDELGVLLSQKQFDYSNRLSSINKWTSILIGIWITAIISILNSLQQKNWYLGIILFLIAASISIYFTIKYYDARKNKKIFGNEVRLIGDIIKKKIIKKNFPNKKIINVN